AFFVGEREYLDGEWQSLARVVQALHGGDCDHDSKRPVVLSGVANGIEMRAEQQGPGRAALVAAPQVTDVVTADCHARLPHPLFHVLLCPPHRVGCEWTDDRFGVFGALREDVATLLDLLCQVHSIDVILISYAIFTILFEP